MNDQMAEILDLLAEPEIGAMIGDARPAWVWNSTGTHLLWANRAGREFFDAPDRVALSRRDFARGGVAASIARIAAGNRPQPTLLQLRFFRRGGMAGVPVQCRAVTLADGSTVVLGNGLARAADAAASLGERARLDFVEFADAGPLALFAADGAPIAATGTFDASVPREPLNELLKGFAGDGASRSDTLIDDETGRHVLRLVRVGDGRQVIAALFPALCEDGAEAAETAENGSDVGEIAAMTAAGASLAAIGTNADAFSPEEHHEQDDAQSTDEPPQPPEIEPATPQDLAETETAEPSEHEASAEEPAPQDDIAVPAFTFEKRNRPDRFVWQMDADGRFSFVSHEFANSVGPAAAQLVDRNWREVAATYDLKDDGAVGDAIARRDTWSGITIDWPVEGAAQRVPVDLAALPAFGRDRIFEGYRGFGVCRTMDAKDDPDATGLRLSATDETTAPVAADDQPHEQEEAIASDAADAPEQSDADDAITAGTVGALGAGAAALWSKALDTSDEDDDADADEPEASTASEEDGALEEPPAPRQRGERVAANTSHLSKPEREAFRQIANALGARLEDDDGDDDLPSETAPDSGAGDGRDDDVPTADAENVVPLPSAFAAGRPTHIDPTVLDRLPIGILISRDHKVLYANRPMLDMVDYPSRVALDKVGGLESIIGGPEDRYDGDVTDSMADHFVRLKRRDGSTIAVVARLHAVPWSDGNALMMSFRPVELGERSTPPTRIEPAAPKPDEAIAALRHRVAELDAILDTATDGVLMLDGEGTVHGANRSAEALFGMDRADIVDQPLAMLLAPESRRAARDYLDGLTKNGVASVLNDGREVIGSVSQGGLIPLFMTIGRIGEGDDAKYCAVLRDITQWKKAEEELTAAKRSAEDASSQKSDFLAKISHEIRTPLNAIIGFSEVMMEQRFGAIENERYREYLRDIHASGEHIMSLINDLLDLSKIEAGKVDLSFDAVSISEVVQDCVALTQPEANRHRIIIRTSLPASVPKIVADARSLRQIVLNLLSNAIKFNNPGGQVIVSTALEDSGEVVIRVRDTGIGMSDEDIETALEPFRQLHTSRHGGGTGLGLPLTKALTEANRASFAISSELGQGTLVEIAFPTTRVLAE